ncbi:20445_t:CDS:2, partial [Gigaspora margarita]
ISLLPNLLKSDPDKEIKKSGNRLERIMLNASEWDFIKELVDILEMFEKITKELSGQNYITISIVYPAIYKLIRFLKVLVPSTKISNYNESDEEDFQEDDYIDEIYDEIPDDQEYIGLLATILDPRFKQMTNFDSIIIHKAKTLLQTEYTNLKAQTQNPNNNEENVQIENTESEDLSSSNTMKSLLDDLYEDISFEEIESDELEKYLNLPGKKCDPLLWWNEHKQEYPILYQLAVKYF